MIAHKNKQVHVTFSSQTKMLKNGRNFIDKNPYCCGRKGLSTHTFSHSQEFSNSATLLVHGIFCTVNTHRVKYIQH